MPIRRHGHQQKEHTQDVSALGDPGNRFNPERMDGEQGRTHGAWPELSRQAFKQVKE